MAAATVGGGAEMGQGLSASTGAARALITQGTWTPTFGVQGLDVSAYQPGVDWQQQWTMGARFAYVKATEGNYYKNPLFGAQYGGSRSVGMMRGAYHYANPSASSGADQARIFVQSGGGWTGDGYTLPPVLDFEGNPYAGQTIGGYYQGNTCYDMSPAALTAWARDFSNTMQAMTGRLPVIYTGNYWWSDCVGNPLGFGDNPLWLASYPSSASNSAGPIPASWSSYGIWQYSESGPYTGDSNVWNGDYASLQRFAGVRLPTGSFDELSQVRSGSEVSLRVRGWAVDLSQPQVSSQVHVYVTDPSNVTTGYAFPSDKYRLDVNQALGFGSSHGFDNSIRITKSGTYKACAYAIGRFDNTLLECKTFQAFGVEPPVGSFDVLGQVRTSSNVSLRLSGWAIDQANAASATWADAYVTGPDGKTTGYRLTANKARADVNASVAYGFDSQIAIAQAGTYSACLYAIGQYSNTALGCKQFTVESNPAPTGSYDTLSVVQTPGAARLQVTGWTLDRTAPAASTPVHIYVRSPDGSNFGYAFAADKPRPDVNQAIGTIGDHGFNVQIDVVRTGTYSVCAYAIPVAPLSAGNTTLGCTAVTVSQTPAPLGYVDSARIQSLNGQASIAVDGWTFDPAIPAASNPVHIYVTSPDGNRTGYAFAADRSRPDVNKAFGIGGNHGYSTFTPLTQRGPYTVCAYGIGIAEFGPGNPLLGCKTLSY
ncbi:GH25 family lysozyme M1 (1,4-beta-N-acetylmuramidase) [Arthrobacter sp. UYEF3]